MRAHTTTTKARGGGRGRAKRKVAAVLITAGLVGGVLASPASADPGVGRPTNPSCFGQSIRGFAHEFGGIRNAVDANGVTFHQGHNLVRGALCGRTSGFAPWSDQDQGQASSTRSGSGRGVVTN